MSHKTLDSGYYSSPRWSWEILDCSMPMTFDTYGNCAHQCVYCFAYFQRAVHRHGSDAYLAHKVKAVNVDHVKRLFTLDPDVMGNISNSQFAWYIKNKYTLQWGGLSDGFDWYERLFGKSLELLKFFVKIEYPVSISTKGVWFLDEPEYRDVFQEGGEKGLIHMKYSIITSDADKAKKVEAGCPSPTERFEAMQKLHELGVPATLRFRPYIIGISDEDNLIAQAAAVNAQSVTTEFLCIEGRASENHHARYKAISEVAGYDVWDFYRKHSMKAAGLMRLNYDLKRPYIERMAALCAEHDLPFFVSDAHHKEKSEHSGCCGLPSDDSPIANGFKGHFAEAILIAKEKGRVHWRDIAPLAQELKEIPYIRAANFNHGDSLSRAKNMYNSMYEYMQNNWNAVKSFNSPARYFGGALIPKGIDEDGDVWYEYNELYIELGERV